MATSKDDQARIERLEELLELVRAEAGAALETNWVTAMDVNTGGTPAMAAQVTTAAGVVAVMGILLKPKTTGLYHVDLSVAYTSGTTGVTNTWQLVSCTSAAGVMSAGGGGATIAPAGYGSTGSGFAAGSANADCEVLTSSAAGVAANGLLYNGLAFTSGVVVQKTQAVPTLTGRLDGVFEAHGIMGNSSSNTAAGQTKTPFTIGNTVAFGLLLSGGAANTITFNSIDFTVQEISAL